MKRECVLRTPKGKSVLIYVRKGLAVKCEWHPPAHRATKASHNQPSPCWQG